VIKYFVRVLPSSLSECYLRIEFIEILNSDDNKLQACGAIDSVYFYVDSEQSLIQFYFVQCDCY